MPPQSQQTQNTQIDSNQVSVGLAQVNNFMKNHLASQNPMPEVPDTPANEPSADQPANKEDLKSEMTGLETRLMDELQTLREEMKTQGDGKKELADLKAQIEKILSE